MATFTRILLNPARRLGKKYLTNPQALHAAVLASFPPDIDQGSERVLWRLDERGHEYTLYIVGPEKPTASHIVEEAGWDVRPAQTADYDRFLKQLTKGQQWNFELVANPTKSISRGEGKRGKVTAIVNPEQQLEWLHKKSESIGVSFGDLDSSTARVIGKEMKNFQRISSDGVRKNTVHFGTARFAGKLEVTDPDKLREALVKGIGRAKGYGCGLLTLARDEHAL